MSRTTKVRTTLGLGAVAVAVLAALTVVSRPAPAAPALKPYKVGFNAWIGSIAFFVARDKGFFKERAWTCRPRASARRATGSRRCSTGDLDAAPQHGRQRAHRARQGARAAQGRLPDGHLGGGRRDAGQEGDHDVKAMKGKKVAATLGQCNHLLLRKGAGEGRTDREGHRARQHEPRRRRRRVRRREDRRRRDLGAVDHQGLGREEGATSSSARRRRPT